MSDEFHAPLVLIEFYDAASVTDRWLDRKDSIGLGSKYAGDPILACGLLIAEREDVLVLAMTYNKHNDDVSHVMAIPTRAAKSIIHLRGVAGAKMPGGVTKIK